MKSAEAVIEQIPEIYFTKLTEKAHLLSGKAMFEAAEKQKCISFENLLQMMEKMAEYYEENGEVEKAMKEIEKALLLIPIVENERFAIYEEFFKKQMKRLIHIEELSE